MNGQPVTLRSLASKINTADQAFRADVKSAESHATTAGEHLIAAKAQLSHGHWLPWLAEHCPRISVRTAQVYMDLARGGSNSKYARAAYLKKAFASGRRGLLSGDVLVCGDYRCPDCNFEWSGEPRPLKPDEQRELRRILVEMETFPFVRRTFNWDIVGRGGSPEVVGGAGGAPVFDDIVSGRGATRAQVIQAIVRVLRGRKPTALGARALDVAQRRLTGDCTLAPAWLQPDAGVSPQERDRLAFEEFGRVIDEAAELKATG
jgi:hypothetical protein